MLPEVDALPGAKDHTSSLDRHRERGRSQDGLDMGWHVIWPLGRVGVERITFGNEAIEPRFEITSSRGISILLNRETG